MKRVSLRALARSRGCTPRIIRQVGGEWRVLCRPAFDVMYARTRKIATAALRAALEAMPVTKGPRG